jgi:hypothetical protein
MLETVTAVSIPGFPNMTFLNLNDNAETAHSNYDLTVHDKRFLCSYSIYMNEQFMGPHSQHSKPIKVAVI